VKATTIDIRMLADYSVGLKDHQQQAEELCLPFAASEEEGQVQDFWSQG
jgi:hypothetical protein